MLSNFDLSIAQRFDRCHMNKSERCEPVDEIDDGERERRKRRDFIRHLREREERKERYHMNEDEKRERRMADYDRQVAEREHADREHGENDAAQAWLVQRQCVEDIRCSESPRATSAATVAEPQLEVFDYTWVQRHVAARLHEQRAYFERRIDELDEALVDQGRTCNEVMNAIVEMVERTLNAATQKSNDHFVGALQKITDTMAVNQRQIMNVVNNKIGGKPIDEPKNAPAKIH
jgi:hypothetical protein